MFTHDYWKEHWFTHLHSRSYNGLLRDEHFKSHGFQKQKYRTYPSFVVNDYFHRNRINSVKLGSTFRFHPRVSGRSKYPIRDKKIFEINNRIRRHERMLERWKSEGWREGSYNIYNKDYPNSPLVIVPFKSNEFDDSIMPQMLAKEICRKITEKFNNCSEINDW